MKNILVALFLVVFASQAGQTESTQEILAEFSNIKFDYQLRKLYGKLFESCNESRLSQLTRYDDDSIATQAAWETVARTIPSKVVVSNKLPPAARNKHYWFIGFLEGRNRVTVPEWWQEFVLGTWTQTKPAYKDSRIQSVRCPIESTVIEKDGRIFYSSGENSIALPRKLFVGASSVGNVTCEFTDLYCFFAVHGNVGYAHAVGCIDRKTGDLVWESKTCGCYWSPTTGVHKSCVELLPTDDGRLFVFGSASTGFYFHGFDASSGKTFVKFSNNFPYKALPTAR